jgi:hypothetical protein
MGTERVSCRVCHAADHTAQQCPVAVRPKVTRATRLVLVADVAVGHAIRDWRRGDCAHVLGCEADFIAAHGSAQGRCPRACRDFVAR